MMKQLKRDLQAISKDLKALTRRAEKMIKAMDKLEKGQLTTGAGRKVAAKRLGAKRVVARGLKRPSATETVLGIIMRSKKGVDTAAIQKKTGYNSRKIWDIVHRAYKEGKVKKLGRGTYGKV
jgi:hypothetical protein